MKSLLKTYYQKELKDDSGRTVVIYCEDQINEDLIKHNDWRIRQFEIVSEGIKKIYVAFDILGENTTIKNEGDFYEESYSY